MIEPIASAVEDFTAAQDDGPVVMMNLLRFVQGGRGLYESYLRAVQPSLAKVSATIVYGGVCGPPLIAESGEAWDALLVVRYPSRAAFLQMAGDPAYREIAHLRTEALRATVLQPTQPWKPEGA